MNSLDGLDGPGGAGFGGLGYPGGQFGGGLDGQHVGQPVVADLENLGGEHLARPAADALAGYHRHLHRRPPYPPG